MARWLVGVLALATFAPGLALAAPELVGAERCGSCHPDEYADWRASGHAGALARLSRVQQRDATCRSCHTTAPNDDNPALSGVQCESCHGPGSMYAPRHVMKDKELSKLLGLQTVTEEQCAPCHAKDTPSIREFVYAEKVKLVNHSKRSASAAGQRGASTPAPAANEGGKRR